MFAKKYHVFKSSGVIVGFCIVSKNSKTGKYHVGYSLCNRNLDSFSITEALHIIFERMNNPEPIINYIPEKIKGSVMRFLKDFLMIEEGLLMQYDTSSLANVFNLRKNDDFVELSVDDFFKSISAVFRKHFISKNKEECCKFIESFKEGLLKEKLIKNKAGSHYGRFFFNGAEIAESVKNFSETIKLLNKQFKSGGIVEKDKDSQIEDLRIKNEILLCAYNRISENLKEAREELKKYREMEKNALYFTEVTVDHEMFLGIATPTGRREVSLRGELSAKDLKTCKKYVKVLLEVIDEQ